MDHLFFNRNLQDQSLEALLKTHQSKRTRPASQTKLNLSDLIPHRQAIWKSFEADLKSRSYAPEVARVVPIFTDKVREMASFDWIDRLLMDHLARILAEVVEPKLPQNLWSFRKGRGQHEARQCAQSYIKKQAPGTPIFVLRLDIKNYGDSLKHDFILRDFKKYAQPSDDLIFFVEQICRYRKLTPDGRLEFNHSGLPMGSYIQLVFENIYLLDLDHLLERIPDSLSLRFGDDILFLTTREDRLQEAREIAFKILNERGLQLNKEKSAHFILDSRGACRFFEYLGMRIWVDGRLSLPPRKSQLIRKVLTSRIRHLARLHLPSCQHSAELITRVSAGLREYVHSIDFGERLWPYIREITDENELRELDRWLCLRLLKETLKGGFTKAHYRHHPPKDLRKRGLPSLLHLRRTFNHD